MVGTKNETYQNFTLGAKDDINGIYFGLGWEDSNFNACSREELLCYPRGPYGGLELLPKDFIPNQVAGYFCGAKKYKEHYELTGEVGRDPWGKTLFRIKALKTFAIMYIPNDKSLSSSFFRVVEAGDVGGWVSDPLQIRYGWVFDEGIYSGRYKLDGAIMDDAVVSTDFSLTQLFSFDKDYYLPERYWHDDIGLPVHTVVRGECIINPTGGVWNSLLSGKIIVENAVVSRVSCGFGNFRINGRLGGIYNFFVFESPWMLSNAFSELRSNGSQITTIDGPEGEDLENICYAGLNHMNKGLLEGDLDNNPRNPHKGNSQSATMRGDGLSKLKDEKKKIWANDPQWEYSRDEVREQERHQKQTLEKFGFLDERDAVERGSPPRAEDCPQEIEGEFTRIKFDREQIIYEEMKKNYQ